MQKWPRLITWCARLMIVWAGVCVFLISPSVQAVQTTPYTVGFQGRLTDSLGNVVPDGTYNMKLRLYTAVSGGTNVWTETRGDTGVANTNRVQITNGLFSVQLGEVSALSPSLFSSGTYPLYLEVELPSPATSTCTFVGCAAYTETPMTPRQAVSSAPYALNADTIDGIDGTALAQLSANQSFTGNNTFTGTFLMRPSSDSTTAFQINNNAGSSLLVGDTTNLMLKVGGGDVSPSTTPALLVLDYKNTTGDPATGVNGAMYYNSAIGKMRCYEEDLWKDCTSPRARYRYEHHNDFVGPYTFTNGSQIDSVFSSGFAGTGAKFNRLPGEANHPGIIQMDTGTGSNSILAVAINYDTLYPIQFGGGAWSLTTQERIVDLSSSAQLYTTANGFIDNANTMSPANGCYIRYSQTSTATNWTGVCRNANVESTCDTGVQVNVSAWYNLNVTVNATATAATFSANDTSCTITTNIPTTNKVTAVIGMIKQVGTAIARVDYDNIEIVGDNIGR